MLLLPGNKSDDSFNFYLQKKLPGGNQALEKKTKAETQLLWNYSVL